MISSLSERLLGEAKLQLDRLILIKVKRKTMIRNLEEVAAVLLLYLLMTLAN